MSMVETTQLIEWGGIIIIICFVFAETGLLLGLIVPGGETLLFTTGLLVSTGTLSVDITILLIVLIAAAILGDISGFFIGRKFKHKLYKKNDTWYFKKKYLTMAEKYIKKHKRSALIFGKFLPVIRPFTPVITGVSDMPFSTFFPISGVASVLYAGAFTLSGYFLGWQIPQIKSYLGFILPISIVIALIPVIIQIRKQRNSEEAA